MTPSALAAAEAVRPQSLTRVLAELEAEGLVLRRQDTADRRQFLLEATDEGREVLRRDVTARALWLDAAMKAQLSPTEQEMLRLAAQLMDRLADAPFGLRVETTENEKEEEG
jgi:DNA-binding MarR family transcriptional regulator